MGSLLPQSGVFSTNQIPINEWWIGNNPVWVLPVSLGAGVRRSFWERKGRGCASGAGQVAGSETVAWKTSWQQCGSGSCCGGLVRWLLTRYWDGERSCICSPRPHPGSASGTASALSRGAAAAASWSAGWADVVGTGDRRGGLGWEGARPLRPRRRVRAEEVGPGGSSAYLCSFVCRRPAHTPHPLVGEAQETTKEFDREAFWRRFSECFSYWWLLSLISSLLLSFLLPPAPASLRGYLPILGTSEVEI